MSIANHITVESANHRALLKVERDVIGAVNELIENSM
jgi:hypothetical protein